MKAVVLEQFGPAENLRLQDLEPPTPGPGQVLVKVHAVGINPVDYKTRMGNGIAAQVQLPLVLGWNIAGEVAALGPDVKRLRVGDAVFGMNAFPGTGNAYAELVVAQESHLALKPTNVSFQQAAAVPLAGLTAWQTLVKTANIGPGSRVLIHAAAGGVGHLAVQLAKGRGAYVVGTASARNEAYVRSLGADQVIDYTQMDFFEVVDNLDVVLDGVGGAVAFTSVLVLKKGGMLLSLPSPLPASITKLAACNHIQTPWVLVASNGEDMQALADLMETGMLLVHVSGVYPFREVGKAHQQVQSARTRGKVVLTLH